MRRPAVLALVLTAVSTPSRADDDLPFDLVPHSARARLVGGRTVVIEARFEFEVDGPLPPPGNSRSLVLPHHALIPSAPRTSRGSRSRSPPS